MSERQTKEEIRKLQAQLDRLTGGTAPSNLTIQEQREKIKERELAHEVAELRVKIETAKREIDDISQKISQIR